MAHGEFKRVVIGEPEVAVMVGPCANAKDTTEEESILAYILMSLKHKHKCYNCGRTSTPQWRMGEKRFMSGVYKLCNACAMCLRRGNACENAKCGYIMKRQIDGRKCRKCGHNPQSAVSVKAGVKKKSQAKPRSRAQAPINTQPIADNTPAAPARSAAM